VFASKNAFEPETAIQEHLLILIEARSASFRSKEFLE